MPNNTQEITQTPVIAVFDIGKTNKKILLFNQQYEVVWEQSIQLDETTDADGFASENLEALTNWVLESFKQISALPSYCIKAINCSAYGASFVHINNKLVPFLPLYNYLKPYPKNLQNNFYASYGGEQMVSRQTASPVLGNLNSGLQLYRLKKENPETFNQILYSLHLPQYIAYIFSKLLCSDITSIGCHTTLWNFDINNYHEWVTKESILPKLAPLKPSDYVVHQSFDAMNVLVGVGLHDSSAALIPYLSSFSEPFLLLSTGTWCISMNPFNQTILTDKELNQDCLCYLSYQGMPIKSSRLFAGYAHEQQVKKLADFFVKPLDYYTSITYDKALIKELENINEEIIVTEETLKQPAFAFRNLILYNSYELAYHRLMKDIIELQVNAIHLVIHNAPVTKIFVDGGFSKNELYMHLLAKSFPELQVYAANVAQASALGAALAIHKHWNTEPYPNNIISLKQYSFPE